MFEVILLIIGAAAGFYLYKMIIMSNFRQNTINNKKNAFDAILESWTEIRHFILANHKGKLLSKEANDAIDEMHKNSKQLTGNLGLVCDNQLLIADIEGFNESIYQNEWDTLDLKKLTAVTDQMKADSLALAERMGDEVNNGYRLEWQDLKSCATGVCSVFTSNFTSPSTQTNNESQNKSTSASTTTSNAATSGSTEYKEDWIEKLLKSKFSFLKDWDIRSLSRKTGTTEQLGENKQNEPSYSATPESKPKKAPTPTSEEDSKTNNKKPASTEIKPKTAVPTAENKTKKTDSAAENKVKKEKPTENKPK